VINPVMSSSMLPSFLMSMTPSTFQSFLMALSLCDQSYHFTSSCSSSYSGAIISDSDVFHDTNYQTLHISEGPKPHWHYYCHARFQTYIMELYNSIWCTSVYLRFYEIKLGLMVCLSVRATSSFCHLGIKLCWHHSEVLFSPVH
jgi:hypothetical protein